MLSFLLKPILTSRHAFASKTARNITFRYRFVSGRYRYTYYNDWCVPNGVRAIAERFRETRSKPKKNTNARTLREHFNCKVPQKVRQIYAHFSCVVHIAMLATHLYRFVRVSYVAGNENCWNLCPRTRETSLLFRTSETETCKNSPLNCFRKFSKV